MASGKELSMINYYRSVDGRIVQAESCEKGYWVNVVNPSEQEIEYLINRFDLDPSYISASLDEEESPHIEKEQDDTLIILDTPMVQRSDNNVMYYTIPIGIISASENVITISTRENPVFDDFIEGKAKDCNTEYKAKFIFQIMLKTAVRFLQHLKQIDKLSIYIEKQLRKSMKNKELIQLLELQKSLVYFNTSLKADEIAIKKISGGRFIKLYEDDRDLLDDVLIELNQAGEMAGIYLNILSGTMDAFASVISNNLNIVMRVLASITIVISIPTIISSFYGMNVSMIPMGVFWFPVVLSVVTMAIVGFILFRAKMF